MSARCRVDRRKLSTDCADSTDGRNGEWARPFTHLRNLCNLWIVLILVAGLTGCAAAGNRQGNRLYTERQYDQALLAYQAAQAELPEQAELHYNVGNTLHRMGDYAKAVTETLQVRPDAPAELLQSTAYNLGNSLYRLSDFASAVEAYKQALRMKPDDQDAKYNLELALRKLQEQQEQQQEQQKQDDQQQDQAETPTPQADQQGGASTPTPQSGSTPNATTTPSPQAEQQNAGTPTPQAASTAMAQAGMTPQQALQLLQALAQDEQTLQEILAQMEQFPDRSVEKDW